MNTILFSFLVATSPTQQVGRDDAAVGRSLSDSAITFTNSIALLLKANCAPCHFPGGTVYEKYPFELYETAFTLRKKLGTRLKETEQQALLARWLQGGAKE